MGDYLKALLKRKDLLLYLVISGLKAEKRDTILGYFWWILDPLLMGIVYYLLRVVILGMEGENIGAFLIIGLVVWKWLSSAIITSVKSITSRAGIITQIYLPKAIFPFGTTLTQTINFIFGLVVIVLFLAFYRIIPGFQLLWLPVIIIIQFLFLSAISLFLAYFSVFIHDIESLLIHLMRLWFYASPVIWEADRLPSNYHFIVQINPASILLISFRNVLMHDITPDVNGLMIVGGFSIALIIYMIKYYSKNEHKIIKAL